MSDLANLDIKAQALLLARENKMADPNIERIYWLPNPVEVRLIELEATTVKCLSGAVEPFYFDPSPEDGLSAPSGIALIRPDEFRVLALPESWGRWDDAVKLEV